MYQYLIMDFPDTYLPIFVLLMTLADRELISEMAKYRCYVNHFSYQPSVNITGYKSLFKNALI